MRLRPFALVSLAVVTAAAASTPREARAGEPSTATGRVVDVQGRPVAGAAIEVSIMGQDYRRRTLGQGVSDGDGRFAVSLSLNEYDSTGGIGVDAPGFVSDWASFPGGIVDETIVLRRIVDRPFLEALRAVRDPQERARRVLEIAASDAADLPEMEEMFPYLGELRRELAAIVVAGTEAPTVRRTDWSPAYHASRLLAYWADPADDALLAPWIKENWGARPAHVAHLGLSAGSVYEVCARWSEIHAADQSASGCQALGTCRPPLVDRTGTHALALFGVRYAHWGYDMYLVMRREGKRWVLRGVADNKLYHFRPAQDE
jgi:hypothetical protein